MENLILSQESDHGTHIGLRQKREYHKYPGHWIGKFNLGLTPFKITNVQRLTREDEKKQTESGKRLLHYMKLANLEKIFFTNEKIFKLKAPNNKQNDRIYVVNLSDIREKGHSEKS